MSAFCPNCSAPLISVAVASCENCDASFTHPDGWRPVSRPLGKFVPRVKKAAAREEPAPELPSASAGEKVIRGLIGIPLLLAGFGLLVLALYQLGPLAGIPSVLCIAAGLGVLASRAAGATIISISAAGLIYLLLFGGLRVLNAAIYSR